MEYRIEVRERPSSRKKVNGEEQIIYINRYGRG